MLQNAVTAARQHTLTAGHFPTFFEVRKAGGDGQQLVAGYFMLYLVENDNTTYSPDLTSRPVVFTSEPTAAEKARFEVSEVERRA